MDSVDLNTLSLEEKVNLILQKTISNESKMDSMKSELSEKISTLNENLTKQINEVDNRVTTVQTSCNSNTEEIKTVNSELALLRNEVSRMKINEINRDVHSRRFNLVVGNIKDDGGWEAPGTSMVKVRQFLHSINQQEFDEDGNQVYDGWNPDTIVIKEAHRLPQDPTKFSFINNGDERARPRNRLMVMRLECYTDVGIILRKCRHLKSLNAKKPKHYRQFVDRHYPKSVQVQKDGLKNEFNELKAEGLKPMYRFDVKTASMSVVARKKKA